VNKLAIMGDYTPWIAAAVLLAGIYLWLTANRLDRLQTRVEGSRSALDAQLVRRSSVALELATSRLLDPASSLLLAEAAHEARDAPADERELAESSLSRALRAALEEPGQLAEIEATPGGPELVKDLAAACRRVVMARRFHNDAVTATRNVRRKRLVRWFRLSGRAPLPSSFEMDDEPPKSLGAAL
jgi:hypothetical protein